jgi:glycosyltransferase involved in cell wall biosynthesis
MNKEIIVYTCGDSNDICTWSNVPYLFCKALEKRGWILHRVDISPNKRLDRLFTTPSYMLFRRILKLRACPEYHRSWIHRFLTRRKIRKATKRWPDVDFNLFLSFAFTNPYSKVPSVLWCDWTDAVVIERMGRKPQWYEKASLRHETRVMQRADLVYTLFPVCSRDLSARYKRPVIYLNRNVVNTVYNKPFDLLQSLVSKQNRHCILFVGNHRYQGAALYLITAFQELSKSMPDAELHIIGMTAELLNVVGESHIHCYGYLRKNVETECTKYYELMIGATLLVNPAANWGAYSSTIEAMYYGTPVIVTPYDDFVADFGREIEFGYYLEKPDNLLPLIKKVLSQTTEEYQTMCLAAREAVKDYTWDKYVDVFLDSLKQYGVIK